MRLTRARTSSLSTGSRAGLVQTGLAGLARLVGGVLCGARLVGTSWVGCTTLVLASLILTRLLWVARLLWGAILLTTMLRAAVLLTAIVIRRLVRAGLLNLGARRPVLLRLGWLRALIAGGRVVRCERRGLIVAVGRSLFGSAGWRLRA